jgi:recombination DNA repair RAD52 pathway protein
MDIQEIRKKLDEKIPRDVVRQRDGGGGRSFSYLEGHYVIARLNEVFGNGGWSYTVKHLEKAHTGTIQSRSGEVHRTLQLRVRRCRLR